MERHHIKDIESKYVVDTTQGVIVTIWNDQVPMADVLGHTLEGEFQEALLVLKEVCDSDPSVTCSDLTFREDPSGISTIKATGHLVFDDGGFLTTLHCDPRE
jgi:hypothetical protein